VIDWKSGIVLIRITLLCFVKEEGFSLRVTLSCLIHVFVRPDEGFISRNLVAK
jgi:hypothetical protein